MLPQDPIMLLSYVNTKLRDSYSSLDLLCSDLNIDRETLVRKLDAVNYTYDSQQNRFVGPLWSDSRISLDSQLRCSNGGGRLFFMCRYDRPACIENNMVLF